MRTPNCSSLNGRRRDESKNYSSKDTRNPNPQFKKLVAKLELKIEKIIKNVCNQIFFEVLTLMI